MDAEILKIMDVAFHVAGALMRGEISADRIDDEIARFSEKADLSETRWREVRYLLNSMLAFGDGILAAQRDGTWKITKRLPRGW